MVSASLHADLQSRGIRSRKQRIETKLADGGKTRCDMDTYVLPVVFEERTLHSEFIVLPGSCDNRTLLGCDFIEDVGTSALLVFHRQAREKAPLQAHHQAGQYYNV